MKSRDLIGLICGFVTLVGVCFGIYFFAENRYAMADELEKTKQRLEQKIKMDRLNSVQERVWKIEDRMDKRKLTDLEKQELQRLKEEKEQLSKTIKP